MQPSIPSQAPQSAGEGVSVRSDVPFDAIPAPGIRPKRRRVFLAGIVDILLALLAFPVVGIWGTLIDRGGRSALVERTDTWRFNRAPSGDHFESLKSWAASAGGINGFRVARKDGDAGLVLQYARTERLGPVRPPWESWGYEHPYLVSSGAEPLPPSLVFWLFFGLSNLALGAVARHRIAKARREGVPLGRLFSRPRGGWWWILLLGFAVLAAANECISRVARMIHLNDAIYVPAIFLGLSRAGSWTISAIVAAAGLIGPFVEECLFRGLVYGRFRAFGYSLSGAVISAAMFAACHGGSAATWRASSSWASFLPGCITAPDLSGRQSPCTRSITFCFCSRRPDRAALSNRKGVKYG